MTTDSSGHARPDRPRWSLSEAARRCGVGRATLQRKIEAGRIPGATKTENGWSIGVEDLLAAGLHPDRPTPPAAQKHPAREPALAVSGQVLPEHARRIAELEAELATERVKRAAAEQLAAGRGEHITDLRTSLRMLEAARPVSTVESEASKPEIVARQMNPQEPISTLQVPMLRGWLRRRRPRQIAHDL
jgi:hypothetical protein